MTEPGQADFAAVRFRLTLAATTVRRAWLMQWRQWWILGKLCGPCLGGVEKTNNLNNIAGLFRGTVVAVNHKPCQPILEASWGDGPPHQWHEELRSSRGWTGDCTEATGNSESLQGKR